MTKTPSRYDTKTSFKYSDVDRLKKVLVGREIVSTHTTSGDYTDDVIFLLDNDMQLRAHSTHGGCVCRNGCFSVSNPDQVRGRIMNVELDEQEDKYESGVLRLFVFTDLGKYELVHSEGSDNGYYGWGFWLSVQPANFVVIDD